MRKLPQCSVGVFIAREIKPDPDEGGEYVGFLTEGHFEHVALTQARGNCAIASCGGGLRGRVDGGGDEEGGNYLLS